mgnify:CR=1 FL=1
MDGHYIIWDHISNIPIEDLECGLHLCPKITTDHLNPYSVMNVRLPVQVLRSSVSTVLKTYSPQQASGTAKFCEMIGKFFDCKKVRNSVEFLKK